MLLMKNYVMSDRSKAMNFYNTLVGVFQTGRSAKLVAESTGGGSAGSSGTSKMKAHGDVE